MNHNCFHTTGTTNTSGDDNDSNNNTMMDIPPNKPMRRRSNEHANANAQSSGDIPGEKVTSSHLIAEMHDIAANNPSTSAESQKRGRRRNKTCHNESLKSKQQQCHPIMPGQEKRPMSPTITLKKKKDKKRSKGNNRLTTTATNASNDVTANTISPNHHHAALSRTRRQRLSLSSSSLSLSSSTTTLESIIESLPSEWS